MTHELLHALKLKKKCAKTYVAIKIDISKVYDSVEWRFLEQVMKHMGFDGKWKSWIMSRVTTVTYLTLINGSTYGDIKPTRGIW